jgi:exosome complex RNA-binding protein Rrp42 (RNase PH superfamily)
MENIILEPGSVPKIKIELNDKFQPIGENYRKLSGVIGVQTRKMLPVGCSDWRLVDPDKKMELWADIQVLYSSAHLISSFSLAVYVSVTQ